MLSLQISIAPTSFLPLCAVNIHHNSRPLLPFSNFIPSTLSHSYQILPSCIRHSHVFKTFPIFAISSRSDSKPDPDPDPQAGLKPKSKAKTQSHNNKSVVSQNKDENQDKSFPTTIPKKPRRGRRSEAVAVEDFIRNSLERTFESIRQQSPEVFENKVNVMKDRLDNDFESDRSSDEDEDEEGGEVGFRRGKKMVVEEDDPDWPLDADVGWGIRASEYFEQHPIKNVVGEDGFEIDWEGEIDDSWVKEINCLEWESFAFHPSPLIVLVFERYNRATNNWKTLKELEKAIQVYWNAKDRLPPRAVKLDINIERDLASALKVRECPQILFFRGNRIVYREKEFRMADELVQMIAYFYYNAKKPSWIDEAAICRPY
ncbi:thioredoxin-like fold domain-containing protein MRL7, chloroplastic [Herrania umbratica]|uniref:Thioredoxin-like fold domain-containing protein MRL7, chloroplastic n=1 Tax=Herrania umbratica TaxID=108875 RepID=A0A6J1A0H4_9ROSI|nr:thioredoxin-like fold domain-containing protein MRL7, chloroplastic [Herrania umbratica]